MHVLEHNRNQATGVNFFALSSRFASQHFPQQHSSLQVIQQGLLWLARLPCCLLCVFLLLLSYMQAHSCNQFNSPVQCVLSGSSATVWTDRHCLCQTHVQFSLGQGVCVVSAIKRSSGVESDYHIQLFNEKGLNPWHSNTLNIWGTLSQPLNTAERVPLVEQGHHADSYAFSCFTHFFV